MTRQTRFSERQRSEPVLCPSDRRGCRATRMQLPKTRSACNGQRPFLGLKCLIGSSRSLPLGKPGSGPQQFGASRQKGNALLLKAPLAANRLPTRCIRNIRWATYSASSEDRPAQLRMQIRDRLSVSRPPMTRTQSSDRPVDCRKSPATGRYASAISCTVFQTT